MQLRKAQAKKQIEIKARLRFDFSPESPRAKPQAESEPRSVYRLAYDEFAACATCGAAPNSTPNGNRRYSPPAHAYIPHPLLRRFRLATPYSPLAADSRHARPRVLEASETPASALDPSIAMSAASPLATEAVEKLLRPTPSPAQPAAASTPPPRLPPLSRPLPACPPRAPADCCTGGRTVPVRAAAAVFAAPRPSATASACDCRQRSILRRSSNVYMSVALRNACFELRDAYRDREA